MHFKERSKLFLPLGDSDLYALFLGFSDCPPGRLVYPAPYCIQVRLQVHAVPLCLFDKREPLVAEGYIVVQTTPGNGKIAVQEFLNQTIPFVVVADQRVAIVRERQAHDALAYHVRDPAKWDTSLG